jgi:hypothetical protein
MRKALRLGFCSLALFASGCGVMRQVGLTEHESSNPKEADEKVRMLLEEGGFRVELLDEVNDGSSLDIRARISAEQDWDTSQVAVRMTGLHRGEIKREKVSVLTDLLPSEQAGAVSDGEGRVIAMVLPASDITDYQFELLWGKEALALVGTDSLDSGASGQQVTGDTDLALNAGGISEEEGGSAPEVETTKGMVGRSLQDEQIQVEQIQVERTLPVVVRSFKVAKRFRCPVSGECKVAHGVELALANDGSSVASEIELGVSYKLKGSDSGEQMSGEQPLVLSGVELQPGQEQVLNLELETELTEAQDEQFEPAVRVAAASY